MAQNLIPHKKDNDKECVQATLVAKQVNLLPQTSI